MKGICSYEDRLKGYIAEYEDVLLGKKNRLSYCYCTGNPVYDEKLSLEVMRYAFEKLLKWTPEMLNECTDETIIYKMKLYYMYKKKISHPSDGAHTIYNVIASKLYPDKIKLDKASVIINVYKDVLSGTANCFPRRFFHYEDGILRLGYCFRYALTELIEFSSVQELYDMFCLPGINAELDRIKLLSIYPLFFETPVDMLHYCLPKSLRDEEYYQVCKRKYLKRRLFHGVARVYLKQYHNYLYCRQQINPMIDPKGNYKVNFSRTIFYYVITIHNLRTSEIRSFIVVEFSLS